MLQYKRRLIVFYRLLYLLLRTKPKRKKQVSAPLKCKGIIFVRSFRIGLYQDTRDRIQYQDYFLLRKHRKSIRNLEIGISRFRTGCSTETEQYGFRTEEKIKEGHRSNCIGLSDQRSEAGLLRERQKSKGKEIGKRESAQQHIKTKTFTRQPRATGDGWVFARSRAMTPIKLKNLCWRAEAVVPTPTYEERSEDTDADA